MAEKKYLDRGGLEHAWDRIKSYLTTWKTTNFGSGTYLNSGSLLIGQNIAIEAGYTLILNQATRIGTRFSVDNLEIVNAREASAQQPFYILKTRGMAIIYKYVTMFANVVARNNSGVTITLGAISLYPDESGIVQSSFVYKEIANMQDVTLESGRIHLLFWS